MLTPDEQRFKHEMILFLPREVGESPNLLAYQWDEQIEQRAIRMYRAKAMRVATRKAFDRGAVNTSPDIIRDALIGSLESYLYTIGEETHTKSVSYPRDWWEALKDRFAPKWFLNRYPVKFERVTLSVDSFKGVCPHIGDDQKQCQEWLEWASVQDSPEPTTRVFGGAG